jgi:hypothetical protein
MSKMALAFGFCHFGGTGGMVSNLEAAYRLDDIRRWPYMEQKDAGFMGYCIDAPGVMPAGASCNSREDVADCVWFRD